MSAVDPPRGRSPALGLSDCLCEMLERLLGRSPVELTRALAEQEVAGLSTSQAMALLFLSRDGPRAISDVADHLGLSPSAATHIIDHLVEAGLLRRWEDKNDRRLRRLEVSPTGAATAAQIRRARTRELDRALGALTPETRKKLEEVVRGILTELGDQASEPARAKSRILNRGKPAHGRPPKRP